MLGEYRVAETRLHEALDRFRVISLHQHVRRHADLVEKPVDDHAHIASLWVKQKGDAGEFRSSQRADVSAAHLVCRGAHDEQFFVKKRNEEKAGLGNGERDERQVKAAIEQASNRSEEHTSELQSRLHLVCRLLLEKKNTSQQRFTRVAISAGIAYPIIAPMVLPPPARPL